MVTVEPTLASPPAAGACFQTSPACFFASSFEGSGWVTAATSKSAREDCAEARVAPITEGTLAVSTEGEGEVDGEGEGVGDAVGVGSGSGLRAMTTVTNEPLARGVPGAGL